MPRDALLPLGAPPVRIMGILNVTPDSFADGGRYLDPGAAVAHARELLAEGADVLDVGGESTRPGAAPVSAEEEARRVVPVIAALRREGLARPISVDTRRASVAAAALAAGADLVNDVSALEFDPGMAPLVARAGCPVILMHMRGTPETMQQQTDYGDVVAEVRAELAAKLERALDAGVRAERILLDPGLGFAKTAGQCLELLARLEELAALGRPLVVGASRKSFIGKALGSEAGPRPPAERLEGTLAATALAVRGGAWMVRVHDVRASRRAVRLAEAVRAAGAGGAAKAGHG